jgi:hypothetical protein
LKGGNPSLFPWWKLSCLGFLFFPTKHLFEFFSGVKISENNIINVKIKKENIFILRFFFSSQNGHVPNIRYQKFSTTYHNICKANTLPMLFGMGIISLSQKWWQIRFRNKIYMQPMRGLNRYYALQEGSISWKGGLPLIN